MCAERLGRAALLSFLNSHRIEDAYDVFGFDYEREVRHQSAGAHSRERQSFLDRFQWLTVPDQRTVRRLLNQINSFYSQRRALASIEAAPLDYLMNANRLFLHRTGKTLGIRKADIGFGVRAELPFGDPRRQFQLLRGIAPDHIDGALSEWAAAVDRARRHSDAQLVLMMGVIAIHPFTDGNGRAGRLTFTWIGRRWGLTEGWMAEESDGEFLATGAGLESTEHLMGAFLATLCGENNRIRLGRRGTPEDDASAAQVLHQNLESLDGDDPEILAGVAFQRLRAHLQKDGHIRNSSPRFECLGTALAP